MTVDELIICTRNRPADMRRCLKSVVGQTRLPARVRVVDSSDDDATEDLVRRSPIADLAVYQRATPGLTRQRNIGLAAGRSDVVHFIDDDVLLEPGYIAAILDVFDRDGDGLILGVGGLVTNIHHRPPERLRRSFLLYGDRPGSVLPSGRNVLAVDITAPIDVDWLSGCSMSFRRRVFDRLRFDEGLPGYGLGEDVDLTYRVAQMGRLVVTPAARLQHLQSPTNRLDAVRYTRDELITRARRVRHRTGRLRMRAFWWSVIGQICALVVEREENPGRLSTTVRTALEIARESITSRPRLSPTTQPEPPRV